MPQPKSNHKGVIFSILLGIAAFVFSTLIISNGLMPKEDTLQLYISDSSNYVKGNNGEKDTVFIASEKDYRAYLSEIDLDKSIFLMDSSIIKSNKDTMYSRDSDLLYSRVFISKDSVLLDTKIKMLDNKYASRLKNISSQKNHFFNRYPKILLWILLISIAIGFSVSLIPLFIHEIREYQKEINSSTFLLNLLTAFIIIVFLFLPRLLSYSDSLFIKPQDIGSIFQFGISKGSLLYNSIMPFAGVVFWLVLIFTMNSKISSMDVTEGESASDTDSKLIRFGQIRKDFESYLIIIAVFLAYTIFCNETLLSSLNELVNPEGDFKLLPSEFSFINGLMQSFFLVLIYFIINANFDVTGQRLVANKSNDEVKQFNVESSKKPKDYLKLIFTILAPLLTGSFQHIVKAIFG